MNRHVSCATILAAALLLLATPRAASAYVDPGSGAMLWQLAAAVVIGSLFYVRRLVVWVRKHLGLRSADKAEPLEQQAEAKPEGTGSFAAKIERE